MLARQTTGNVHQFLKRFNEFRRRRPAGIPQLVREHGQHARIEPIGLAEQTHALGEQAGTQRIDDANLIATGMQGAMELAVPLAGGLDHDQAEVVALEPTFERAMALMAVGDAERLFGGQNMDIEPGFADIDSHARFALGLLFGHILALHAGLAPHHLFRTRAEERMDQALPRGSIPRCRGPIRSRRGPRPRSPTPNHFAVSRQNQHARVQSRRSRRGG